MERISLPTRSVCEKRPVVIAVTLALCLLVFGGMWKFVRADMAGGVYMRDFRTILYNYQPIERHSAVSGDRVLTLFAGGGTREPQNERAIMAFSTLDPWDAEMPYLYARALWREYTGPESGPGRTMSHLDREGLPAAVETWLRVAMRRDPTNRFYRATLAGVLMRREQIAVASGRVVPETVGDEIDRLLAVYPPLNAYGQVRTAERLTERKPVDAPRVLAHFGRAVTLASSDVGSGLMRVERRLHVPERRPDATGPAPPPEVKSYPVGLLGQYLVARALDGIIAVAGLDRYPQWAPAIGPRPESHWLARGYFKSRQEEHLKLAKDAFQRRLTTVERREMDEAARWAVPAEGEAKRLVQAVRERLKVQAGVSTWQSLSEIAWPLSRPDNTDRFLLGREIGYAAAVLNETNDFEGARELYEVQIDRRPKDVAPRMALARLLFVKAEPMSREIKILTDATADLRSRAAQAKRVGNLAAANADEVRAIENDGKIKRLREEVGLLYDAAEKQLSTVLGLVPRMPEALDLRLRMGRARREEFEPQ